MLFVSAGNMFYDVIIIGSGPAGTAAAISCCKNKCSVLLLTDKSSKNSIDDAPIESVHPGLEILLNSIGTSSAIADAERGRYTSIKISDTYSHLGEDSNGSWQGFHINKNAFVESCLRIAIEQGAYVKYESKVTEMIVSNGRVEGVKCSNGESFLGKFVIDCSGKKQIVGKKMNFQKEYFSPPLYVWSGIVRSLKSEVYKTLTTEFIPGKNGWSWLAPIGNNCLTWTTLSTEKGNSSSISDFISSYGTVENIIAANMQWRLFRPVCADGVILCGDAAGLLDPASGQGIFNAVLSGINASNCVQKCLSTPAYQIIFLADYDSWFSNYFEDKVLKLIGHYKNLGLVIA